MELTKNNKFSNKTRSLMIRMGERLNESTTEESGMEQAIRHFRRFTKETLDEWYKNCFVRPGKPYSYESMERDRKLSEGIEAITSTPLHQIQEDMRLKYGLSNEQFYFVNNANKVEVFLFLPNDFKLISAVKKDMDDYGFFMSVDPNKEDNGRFFIIQFEPKEQRVIPEDELPYQYLYHFTPYYNMDSIKKYGITPRSENSLFNFPNRVYVVKGNVPKNMFPSIVKMLSQVNKDPRNDGRYYVLEINRKRLPSDIKFHYDPNFEDGLFTTSTIPVSAISTVYSIKLKESQNEEKEDILTEAAAVSKATVQKSVEVSLEHTRNLNQ